MYKVPEGKTFYIGSRVFNSGEDIPPELESLAKANLEHSPPPPPPPEPEPEI